MTFLPLITGSKYCELRLTLQGVWRTIPEKVAYKEIQRLSFEQLCRDALVKTLCLAELIRTYLSGTVQFQFLPAQFQSCGVAQVPKNKSFREICHILGRCPRVVTACHSAIVIEITDKVIAADQ